MSFSNSNQNLKYILNLQINILFSLPFSNTMSDTQQKENKGLRFENISWTTYPHKIAQLLWDDV